MHSPPTSSEIFFSSPPRDDGGGPEEEVEILIATAQKVKALDTNLAATIINNKAIFLDVFGRHVQLLKSRSQAFEDAHVTVYDKVLLHLTKNGNDLESPAAVTWYCAEYLGINPDSQADHNAQLLEQALAVPVAVSQALTPLPSRKHSNVSTLTHSRTPGRPVDYSSSNNDPNFVHLWSVYSKAHTDYLAVADKEDKVALEAAKFLRDTAENGIDFLRGKYPKDPALAELSSTYSMAKTVVLNLNGGKKRKFDYAMEGNRGGRVHGSFPPHTHAHDRENATRRRRRVHRGQEKPRGRGPSGIPYGYTRPVDSYHPA